MGSYDALFLIEESPEAEEQERQSRIANAVFSNGNQLYCLLVALIVGAVFQKEILERRYDEGPEPLALELAYPQATRRAIACLIALYVAVSWTAQDYNWFLTGVAYFCSAWAAYGIYRTILAARAPLAPKDML